MVHVNDEIAEKIKQVKAGDVKSEIFHKLRPPEEFGDSVELSYDDKNDQFRAVVFDPEMGDVYGIEKLDTEEEAHKFIVKTVT